MALSLVPAASSIGNKVAASASRLADSQETFLKLLTTQLKNQDPLSPLDANQFTAQIVQMTGVEQQIYSNQLLEQLVNQGGAGLQNSVGLIGKTVAMIGDTNTLVGGQASWAYDQTANAADVDLEIVDSTGRLVWQGKASDTNAGRHPFVWDGKDLSGAQRPDGGEYRLIVSAKDSNGAAVSTTTYFTGVATAVETNAGETDLFVGRTRAPLSSLVGVTS
jgi:flagellar basal-body rod modification protein FlgD